MTWVLVNGWGSLAALVAVALATYDPLRFLAADHAGGFVVGIVVVITGFRVLRDASLALVEYPAGARADARV